MGCHLRLGVFPLMIQTVSGFLSPNSLLPFNFKTNFSWEIPICMAKAGLFFSSSPDCLFGICSSRFPVLWTGLHSSDLVCLLSFLTSSISTFLTTSVPFLGVFAPCLECLWWSALFSLFRLLFVGCCTSYCVPIVSACLQTYWKFLPRLVLLRLCCSSWLFGPCHPDVFLWIRLAWCPFALIVGVTTWGCNRTPLLGQSSTSKRRSNELSRARKIHFFLIS